MAVTLPWPLNCSTKCKKSSTAETGFFLVSIIFSKAIHPNGFSKKNLTPNRLSTIENRAFWLRFKFEFKITFLTVLLSIHFFYILIAYNIYAIGIIVFNDHVLVQWKLENFEFKISYFRHNGVSFSKKSL